MGLYESYMDLYGLKFIHMCLNLFICVSDVFASLVWPVSLPQALFSAKKAFPEVWNMQILDIARIL